MSSISATTGTTGTTATTGATPTTGSKSILNKDDFLKLMMAELQNQNPLSASNSDPMQYVTELAQFTALEQETNTAQSTAQTVSEQQTSAAVALLGRTVTYTDASGATATGVVQKVAITSAGPTLTVAGNSGVDPASVSEVS